MATKTQPLSASRAGLGSVVVTDKGTGKTQVLSNVGVVQASKAPSAALWIFHSFP
jgi:hypothetical protein